MKSNIDVDDYASFPDELIRSVMIFRNEIIAIYGDLEFEEPYECEHHIEPSGMGYELLRQISQSVSAVLNNYRITCWHATRILRLDKLLKEGLMISDQTSYGIRLSMDMTSLSFSDQEITHLLEKCQSYWVRDVNRRNSINFFSKCDCFDEYAHFADNIGGELVSFALGEALGKSPFSKLKAHGTPLLIKFYINFIDINEVQKDTAIFGFIKSIILYELYKIQSAPEFDGWINNNVPSADFIEVQKILNLDKPDSLELECLYNCQ